MVVRTALVVVTLGAALSACGVQFVHHGFQQDHVVKDSIASVRAQSGSGNVSVRWVDGATETKIHRKVQHPRNRKPEGDSHRMEGNVLVLDDCGNDCSVDYEVAVPTKDVKVLGDMGSGDVTIEGVASLQLNTGSGNVIVRDLAGVVRVDSGSGDFTAERIGGDVTAKLGSGNATLNDVKGKSTVHSGSGDITGEALDGDVSADANSGNVVLQLASKKAVRAESGSGDITVRLPGGPYKVVTGSGSGDKHVGVPTDPNASPEINLRAGSGNIVVQPA